jgi:isoquinoline 1-oxidoreductase beta subunit
MKKSLDRRTFMKSSLLSGGGLMLSFSWLSSFRSLEKSEVLNVEAGVETLNAYIKILANNKVLIYCPNPEFGQNVMTSLPMMVAEELDVAWKDVEVEIAPYDPKVYVKGSASQFTGGSRSVGMWWKPLREAGAAARHMLVAAAAKEWGVSPSAIQVKEGVLSQGGKQMRYGDIAAKAAKEAVPEKVNLKAAKDFTVVRQSQVNAKGKEIVTGSPLFGMDYTEPGMHIAMIQHPPAFGLELKSFDATQALKMPGIKEVFEISLFPEGFELGGFDTRTFNKALVIVGKTTWEVMNARKKLKVQWEPMKERKEIVAGWGGKSEVITPAGLESTQTQMAQMMKMEEAKVLRKDGDPEPVFASATKVLERTYTAPFLAHNSMEPINFFARVNEEGAFLAGPLQGPLFVENTLIKRLGLPAEKIDIKMTRMGGGFGRRSYSQYAIEAALIAQKAKVPVKLVYTREDDMTYGIYRPMYTATYRAALDKDNKLIAFHVRGGGIPEHPIAPNRFPAGAVDHYLAEGWQIPSNVTIGAFRAPRSNFNAAAEQSFLDELAELMGKDPIDFRLELLARAKANPVGKTNDYDPERYAGVLKLVKEKSGWGKPENAGKNRGVAAYFCHASYAAHVVDMVIKDGEPYVESVTSAIDCGIVVNPESAKNMVQGAVVDGIGNALYGALTLKDGVPQQTNFNTYRMIRHHEAPKKIDVHFVQNDIDPTGLGEPPFPPVFGAVANALYRATKKRHYRQPFANGEDNVI